MYPLLLYPPGAFSSDTVTAKSKVRTYRCISQSGDEAQDAIGHVKAGMGAKAIASEKDAPAHLDTSARMGNKWSKDE